MRCNSNWIANLKIWQSCKLWKLYAKSHSKSIFKCIPRVKLSKLSSLYQRWEESRRETIQACKRIIAKATKQRRGATGFRIFIISIAKRMLGISFINRQFYRLPPDTKPRCLHQPALYPTHYGSSSRFWKSRIDIWHLATWKPQSQLWFKAESRKNCQSFYSIWCFKSWWD